MRHRCGLGEFDPRSPRDGISFDLRGGILHRPWRMMHIEEVNAPGTKLSEQAIAFDEP